ncbi:MAG: 2-oxo acid dehydrogenase subunit E2, partial [Prolixibacteraceae bacterium]
DKVKVGQVIMIIETEGEGKKEEKEDKEKDEKKEKKEDTGKEEKEDKKKKEKEDTEEEKEKEIKEGEEKEEEKETETEKEDKEEKEASEKEKKESGKRALSEIAAAPSVRRLAREMDVDIREVEGSGPGNRISAEDVKSHAGKPEAKKEAAPAKEKIKLPDFSKWGSTSKEPMSRIRSITAKNVSRSWQNVPHVTQHDEADTTDLEEFRKRFQDKVEKAGGKLTVTAILLKITAFALQKFPQFNASLDFENEEIIYKHYFNVGIAVDTPQGLLVPVIQDVNKKSLTELSVELTEIAKKARSKKISLDELQGGNFTISNLGGIGGTSFSPIIFPPQVAILGVSRAQYKPVYIGDEIKKRLIIPLSLSYDHRVIDGADGARFLRWICDVIEDPYAMLQ